jgi:hypothetical protein
MVIAFELRALDMRAFELWAQFKVVSSFRVFRVLMFAAPIAGFFLWYRYPGLLPFNDGLAAIGLPTLLQLALLAAFFAIRAAILWRFRRAAHLVEGPHSTHFSAAGIHHVSPLGTQRYEWNSLMKLDVTLGYVLFRFAGHGTVAVPIWALRKHFEGLDALPDEAFLNDLLPLILQGIGEST